MKQQKFKAQDFKLSKPFGGDLLKKAKNRTARPLSTKKSMHLVMRSQQAVGDWSFRTSKNSKIINETLTKTARKFGVRVYDCANGGNHLHLVIKLGNRFTYSGFIRALTGALALKITGSSKGRGLKAKFWDSRPFSRVIEWGRAYSIAKDYMLLNRLESAGIIPYSPGRLADVFIRPYG